MVYVDDFICTYKLHEEDDQEVMYRTQFLQAFNLKSWEDTAVEKKMLHLYEAVKDIDDMKVLIERARTSKHLEMLLLFSGTDDMSVFKMLFKFELFDMTHKCICDAIKNREITSVNKDLLLKNL